MVSPYSGRARGSVPPHWNWRPPLCQSQRLFTSVLRTRHAIARTGTAQPHPPRRAGVGACPYIQTPRPYPGGHAAACPGRPGARRASQPAEISWFDTGGKGCCIRVLAVERPAQRVVDDVLSDPLEGIVVADDVFVEVALPQVAADRSAGGVVLKGSKSTCGQGLEPVDDIRKSDCRGRLPRLPVFRRVDIGVSVGEDQDAVDVIWHDDKRVSLYCRVVVRQLGPHRCDHGASRVQRRAVFHYVAQETGFSERADGDEVRAGSGVVEFGQSKRGPMGTGPGTWFVGSGLAEHRGIVHRTGTRGQAWEPAPTGTESMYAGSNRGRHVRAMAGGSEPRPYRRTAGTTTRRIVCR